ncbi:hypothetical protein FF36_02023 [Frankia torreyi]|uniref:Regulatory protein n=1 Tax=Frankia torreyi TaxID=1856 RepID=A0A0D8BHV3_9ACTN|nr:MULTISPECIES: DUF5685 family protein [Frankia]KJE23574.1 hypothetical protein FF36_02023 [Frankia torreyi]KQC37315.1 transcriptional regulator [Frankia sp. ACN1ag]KQM05879.1 hypothetical protein FF86_101247 [Frankia sp. CpI1-P]
MFGVVRPCRRQLSEDLHAAWMSHLCGLCLTLRDHHGQWARVATNVDAVVVSVLVAAQAGAPAERRRAGPCPFRAMRRIEVPASTEAGPRLAAAVSLAAGATAVGDHVADGDGLLRRRPAAAIAQRVASRAVAAAERTGSGVGLGVALLEHAAVEQRAREGASGRGRAALLDALAPTEGAVSAVLAHTAVVAGCDDNRAPLAAVGRHFGRVVHLLDAVTDQADDARSGSWNPLTATGTSPTEARRLCEDSRRDLGHALAEVRFTDTVDARLARLLFGFGLDHAVDRAFAATGPSPGPGRPGQRPDGRPDGRPPHRRRTGSACLVAAGMFLTCQMCGEYTSPLDGRRKEGLCSRCGDLDCDCCDCCGSCGECAECDCGGCDCGC